MSLGLALISIGIAGIAALATLSATSSSGDTSTKEKPIQKIRNMTCSEAKSYWNNELDYTQRREVVQNADFIELQILRDKEIYSVERWSDKREW